MVTMAQINRLDSRIDELAERLEPKRPHITYDVTLVFTDPDGVRRYSDGTPVVRDPSKHVILLSLQDPRPAHGHTRPD
jgi:hypothetical protein